MKKYSVYEQEQNKLLKDFLFNKDQKTDKIEFIISSYCNQSCEYCYLYKYGKELYPNEIQNFDTIVENFEILINWLEKNNFTYNAYDIFSGEFFNLPIWEDIFEILYNNEVKRKKQGKNPRYISVPSNVSFLLNDIKTQKIENWISKFNEIGVSLVISISIEGPKELEELERPLKTSQIKDNNNFYQKFFEFRKKYSLSAHPMVTKNFVKDYKKNYDWWIDTTIENNITQYNAYRKKDIYAIPMFLEVRDAEQWNTKEALSNYKKFLKYVAEKDLSSIHNNNLDDFAFHFFESHIKKSSPKGDYINIQPYIIGFPHLEYKMPCSIQGGPVFRVGDLAYVPCHRTMYPHFIYGHLIKENNQIIGMEASKPTLAIKIKNLNPNRSVLKCSDCPINFMCIKGCLGSQYEHTNELFCAEDTVCDLLYTKYKTIHEIALEYDLYNWVNKSFDFAPDRKEFINHARTVLENI